MEELSVTDPSSFSTAVEVGMQANDAGNLGGAA